MTSYSKWPEFFPISRFTFEENILKLQDIFNRFRVPKMLVSDNGSTFTSAKISDFCHQNGIKHIRAPPFHPQSNGQIERFVGTFKRVLQKLNVASTVSEILEIFLTSYRITPSTNTANGSSPAEALMHHKIRLYVDVIRPSVRNFHK